MSVDSMDRIAHLRTAQEQLAAVLAIADALGEDMLAAHVALALDTVLERVNTLDS